MDKESQCLKLKHIENLLERIESHGRSRKEEVWFKPRSEIDGKQVQVKFRCTVITVGDIDSVTQQFKADFYLEAAWKEPALTGRKREDINWDTEWDPCITFINAASLDKCTTCHFLNYYDNDPVPEVRLGFRVAGTFRDNLELNDFPFDYQDLTIQVMSTWPTTDVMFCKDMTMKDSIRTDTFTAYQNWKLQPCVTSRVPEQKKQEAGSVRNYPMYEIKTTVVRKAAYYIWNLAFLMFLILVLTFASLAVDPMNQGDRLSVTLTLLLTSVAFKFVVAQSLPTISYLTLLDKYVLFCMIFQALVVVQNACAILWPDRETARSYDKGSAVILAAVLIVFHIVCLLIIFFKIRRRNQTIKDMKKDYKDLCAWILNQTEDDVQTLSDKDGQWLLQDKN